VGPSKVLGWAVLRTVLLVRRRVLLKAANPTINIGPKTANRVDKT
jgi:hypothetical protein